MKRLTTLLVFLLIMSLLYQNIIWAGGLPCSPSAAILDKSLNSTIFPDLNLPENIATIKERYCSKLPKPKTILHIQDSHANYHAQMNIAKVLDVLYPYSSNNFLIAVEGAEGMVDVSKIQSFPHKEAKRMATDYLVKEGLMTGTEFFMANINPEKNILIWGVENRELYKENLMAFREMQRHKNSAKTAIRQIERDLRQLSNNTLNKEQRKFISKMMSYQKDEIGLEEYAIFLKEMPVAQETYKNFGNLMKLIELKGHIDFDRVEEERMALIKHIIKYCVKGEITDVVTRGLRYQTGEVSACEYYGMLEKYLRDINLAGEERKRNWKSSDKDTADKYKNLSLYVDYIKINSLINSQALFEEIIQIERQIAEGLFKTTAQKDIYTRCINLTMIDKFVELKIYREDLAYLKGHKDQFYQYSSLISFLDSFQAFCDLGIKRDEVLVENTLMKMEELNYSKAILITGGFHTEGIKELFKEKGVSYTVVSPRITRVSDRRKYTDLLMRETDPFEKVLAFSGTRLALWSEYCRKLLPDEPPDFYSFIAKRGVEVTMQALTCFLKKDGGWRDLLANRDEDIHIDVEGVKTEGNKIIVPFIVGKGGRERKVEIAVTPIVNKEELETGDTKYSIRFETNDGRKLMVSNLEELYLCRKRLGTIVKQAEGYFKNPPGGYPAAGLIGKVVDENGEIITRHIAGEIKGNYLFLRDTRRPGCPERQGGASDTVLMNADLVEIEDTDARPLRGKIIGFLKNRFPGMLLVVPFLIVSSLMIVFASSCGIFSNGIKVKTPLLDDSMPIHETVIRILKFLLNNPVYPIVTILAILAITSLIIYIVCLKHSKRWKIKKLLENAKETQTVIEGTKTLAPFTFPARTKLILFVSIIFIAIAWVIPFESKIAAGIIRGSITALFGTLFFFTMWLFIIETINTWSRPPYKTWGELANVLVISANLYAHIANSYRFSHDFVPRFLFRQVPFKNMLSGEPVDKLDRLLIGKNRLFNRQFYTYIWIEYIQMKNYDLWLEKESDFTKEADERFVKYCDSIEPVDVYYTLYTAILLSVGMQKVFELIREIKKSSDIFERIKNRLQQEEKAPPLKSSEEFFEEFFLELEKAADTDYPFTEQGVGIINKYRKLFEEELDNLEKSIALIVEVLSNIEAQSSGAQGKKGIGKAFKWLWDRVRYKTLIFLVLVLLNILVQLLDPNTDMYTEKGICRTPIPIMQRESTLSIHLDAFEEVDLAKITGIAIYYEAYPGIAMGNEGNDGEPSFAGASVLRVEEIGGVVPFDKIAAGIINGFEKTKENPEGYYRKETIPKEGERMPLFSYLTDEQVVALFGMDMPVEDRIKKIAELYKAGAGEEMPSDTIIALRGYYLKDKPAVQSVVPVIIDVTAIEELGGKLKTIFDAFRKDGIRCGILPLVIETEKGKKAVDVLKEISIEGFNDNIIFGKITKSAIDEKINHFISGQKGITLDNSYIITTKGHEDMLTKLLGEAAAIFVVGGEKYRIAKYNGSNLRELIEVGRALGIADIIHIVRERLMKDDKDEKSINMMLKEALEGDPRRNTGEDREKSEEYENQRRINTQL